MRQLERRAILHAKEVTAQNIMKREQPDDDRSARSRASIDLYWLPLRAATASDLYHSALEVRVPDGRFVIEQAPMRAGDGAERGVVAEGAVGSRWAGHLRIFRYELRRWRDGVIPDVAEAVESPQRLSDDPQRARRLLALVPSVPTPVWGRDELSAGEMWNSNSIIAWLVARAGLDADAIVPPMGGRAPGWNAGLLVARRDEIQTRQRKPQRRTAAPTRAG